jgi:hypothetical protein
MKNNNIQENKFNFDEVHIVNKSNFQIMLHKFKNLTKEKELKHIFFNIECSNLLNNELDATGSNDFTKAYQDHIEKMNKLYEATNNEIIFTEFLFCFKAADDGSYKFVTFLIPSMKFHKFKEESMMRFQNENLKYLHMMKKYSFEKCSSVNTLSYMSLCEKDKAAENFTKILLEGKPTKKENFKSYYYFPKLVVAPTRKTKETLMNMFEYSYNLIKEDISEEIKDVFRHTMPVIEETFVLEKLCYFKWRHVVAPFEKGCIRYDVKSCTIRFKSKCTEADSQILEDFKEAVLLVCDFLNKDYEAEVKIEHLKLDKEVLYQVLCYIERLTFNQLYLILDGNTIKKPFNFNYPEMTELINELKDLIQWDITDSVVIEKVYKYRSEDIFDMSGLFPPKLLKYLKFEFSTDFVVNANPLNEIKEIRFNYDELFANKSNEKRILFVNYKNELDKVINVLLSSLNNHIKINPKNTSYRVLVEPEVYFDLNRLSLTHYNTQFNSLYNDIAISCPEPVVDKDKTNGYTYTRYYIEFKVTNSYIEESLANNLDLFNSVRDKLVNLMVKAKKEFMFTDELGVTLFFENLLSVNTEATLVGINLGLRWFVILKEIFNKNPTYQDYMDFVYKGVKPDFLDINVINTDRPVIDDLLRSEFQYTTHKMFDYFINNNGDFDSYKRSLPIKFNQDCYLLKSDYSIAKIEKKDKNSIIVSTEKWLGRDELVNNKLKQCDYIVREKETYVELIVLNSKKNGDVRNELLQMLV